MNAIQMKYGPFAKAVNWPGMDHVSLCDAGERIQLVRESSDGVWLRAVLAQAEQKSVRQAASRRLIKLTKEARP